MDIHILHVLPMWGVKPMFLIGNGVVAVVKSSSAMIEALQNNAHATVWREIPVRVWRKQIKVARLQNDYERQIGRVQNFSTQLSISSQVSFSGDFRSFKALQLYSI